MVAILKYKNIDVKNISVTTPEKINGNYTSKILYQEHELTHGNTVIFDTQRISPEKKALIDFYKTMNIEFIKMSDLIKK